MPKKGKGKGGKGKGKKKGKKRTKKLPSPPPLHDLTEIYKKLENGLRTLFDMRVVARKKRLEGWFMSREMTNTKNDNELYHDYLEDNISELQSQIEKLLNLLKEEREALAKAIEDVVRDLQKRLQECLEQTSKVENELEYVRNQLLEYEPLMEELARLMAQIADLLRQIEDAKFDRDQKIRHLTNQFLNSRGRLHNHLEEQLFNLIQQCRKYIMPILWNFMQGLVRDNRCLRWKLSRTDETNILLAEKREELMRKRKLLTLEKPYWNIEWAFFKLSEMDSKRSRAKESAKAPSGKIISSRMVPPVTQKSLGVPLYSSKAPSGLAGTKSTGTSGGDPRQTTQLGRDFNNFLLQRLTAAREAQARAEKEKQKAEKQFLKQILDQAASKIYHRTTELYELGEEPGEHDYWNDDGEEDWEEYEEDEDEDEGEEDEDEEEEEHDEEEEENAEETEK